MNLKEIFFLFCIEDHHLSDLLLVIRKFFQTISSIELYIFYREKSTREKGIFPFNQIDFAFLFVKYRLKINWLRLIKI